MQINEDKADKLNKHLELVLEANKIHNLTSIKNFDDGKILHIEDSLAALPEINSAGEGAMVDLGTGGGFPGIPLAIVTERKTVLVEKTQKKSDCLKSFISELDLESIISVSNLRIEELAVQMPNKFKIATARALSSLSSLLELSSPLLQINGRLICYKADNIEEELSDAMNIQDKLGMKLVSNRYYKLSNEVNRRIIVFEKINDAEIKLPRKLGFAQKKPLS